MNCEPMTANTESDSFRGFPDLLCSKYYYVPCLDTNDKTYFPTKNNQKRYEKDGKESLSSNLLSSSNLRVVVFHYLRPNRQAGVPESLGFDYLQGTLKESISAHPKFDQKNGDILFHGRQIPETLGLWKGKSLVFGQGKVKFVNDDHCLCEAEDFRNYIYILLLTVESKACFESVEITCLGLCINVLLYIHCMIWLRGCKYLTKQGVIGCQTSSTVPPRGTSPYLD